MMARPLSTPKIGEISIALAFAILDLDDVRPDRIIEAWSTIGDAMPLSLALARNAIERRPPPGPADVAAVARDFMDNITGPSDRLPDGDDEQ